MVAREEAKPSQDSPEARNTREVVAVRFAEGERWQVAQAAALQKVPFSSYIRAASVRAAFDYLQALQRSREKGAKTQEGVSSEHLEKTGEAAVLDIPDQPAVHYVDGEPVSWRLA
jgi:hypothetical protein